MSPQRIQRQRTKGWRMPESAVYVGRPTEWGNPAKAGNCRDCLYGFDPECEHRPMTAADAVMEYRVIWEALLQTEAGIATMTPEELRLTGVSGVTVDYLEPLRGRDLACWCPLDQPCHADVLLELANLS